MSSTIILELGDIIEIISPQNITYHEKVFIIDYIDGKQIYIIEINHTSSTLKWVSNTV